jgi:mitotic spindle assembly checkpoint protein MAD1
MVTEERDRLKNVVNELKRPKNDQGGDEAASGVLLQVLELNSSSIFLGTLAIFSNSLSLHFAFHVQELESSLAQKEFCIKELESNLHAQKEVNSHQLEEIKTLNDMLNNEARRIKSLERESDRLRAEISLLESKVILKLFQELPGAFRIGHFIKCFIDFSNFLTSIHLPNMRRLFDIFMYE